MARKAKRRQALDDKARAFWSWFASAESRLRDIEPDSAAGDELDAQLSALGIRAWEIGPAVASSASYSFALSPGGDPKVYRKTRKIVELAPSLPEWEFLPAKPRKFWDRKFLWSEERIPVDASKWKFLLYRFDDGLSDIVLLGDVLAEFAADEQLRILDFVIESELGEASCIELLNSIDIDRAPSRKDLKYSFPILDLFQAIVAGRDTH